MQRVGIRAPKERTSDILRQVREEGAAIEVTHRGRAIAHIVPVIEPSSSLSVDEFWQEWDKLARAIGEHWPEGESAVDAVREQRRDL